MTCTVTNEKFGAIKHKKCLFWMMLLTLNGINSSQLSTEENNGNFSVSTSLTMTMHTRETDSVISSTPTVLNDVTNPDNIHNTLNSTETVQYNVTASIPSASNSTDNNVIKTTVDYNLLREIEYYNNLARRIWKIWSPVLLGKIKYFNISQHGENGPTSFFKFQIYIVSQFG